MDRVIPMPWGEAAASLVSHPAKPWLTLLHTLATDRSLWSGQVVELAQYFNLLLIDMRGHGDSAAAEPPYSIAGLGDDVVAIWDTLDIRASSVAGLSIGGMIALSLAAEQPERVIAMIAGGCRAQTSDQFRAMWSARRTLLTEGGLSAVIDATIPTWFPPESLEAKPALSKRVAEMIGKTSIAGYIGATQALEELDLFDRLPAISAPCLLLVGDKDGPHPGEMAKMKEQIAHSDLTTITGAGHLPNLDQPEQFMAAIMPFLIENGVGNGE
jgi:3-oxoadipate enol-lactonase